MNGFVEQLRLAEKAAEDIYFSKVDRELIEDLHKRMQAEKSSNQPSDNPAPKKYCGTLARLHTEADVKSNTGTKQCPLCSESVKTDAKACRYCGHDLLVLTPSASAYGWVTVEEYVVATSHSEEDVMSAIRKGDTDGRLICGTWMVQYE
jgi:hypothetical protein